MESILTLFLYFSIISFIGWLIEIIFCLITENKLINPGFLYGPFVPIYGFVVLTAYLCSVYLQGLFFPFLLIIYFLIPTGIEYLTAYVFEKIFHMKFWDYSNYKFNFKGRICLGISLIWFLLILFAIYALQPFILKILNNLPELFASIISILLAIYFLTDLFFSIRIYYYFSKIRNKLTEFAKSYSPTEIKNFLMENPLFLKIKNILRPLKAFSNLRKKIYDNNFHFIERLRLLKKIKREEKQK
jgi:uncharacterized membrane protein